MPDPDGRPDTAMEPAVAAAIVDVFVYVVVLNLFVEYLPQVISESFTLSPDCRATQGRSGARRSSQELGQGSVPSGLHPVREGHRRPPAMGGAVR